MRNKIELKIEYKDTLGQIRNETKYISKLQFIKHMAMSGQAYFSNPSKLKRLIGMFFMYSDYLKVRSNCFGSPTQYLYDPTEKNQFSNLAGKSIADYLAKEISKAKVTYSYE